MLLACRSCTKSCSRRTISGTIGEIKTISAAIASAVEEQNATTAAIARNADQAARGSREASLNIGSVSKTAADAGAAASDILQSAVGLTKESEALRAGADAFIARVRAAWPAAGAGRAGRADGRHAALRFRTTAF